VKGWVGQDERYSLELDDCKPCATTPALCGGRRSAAFDGCGPTASDRDVGLVATLVRGADIHYIRMQEVPMAHITVKDLPLDVELDRQAMAAIVGGARSGAAQPPAARLPSARSSNRIVDYPPGFASNAAPAKAKLT
jgi:hypothetical protein